jgi:hypothetical protein
MEATVYPIVENLQHINESEIASYLEMLFGEIDWQEGQYVCLRGIGEKGTPREGEFRDDVFLQPAIEDLLNKTVECCRRWAQFHGAAFIVPAILKAPRGKADNVALFTNLLVDLDSGDTTAKLDHLREHLGEPSLTVLSGGITEEGKDKLHVYYRLQEPTDDVRQIVQLRDEIAWKSGGDPQFGLGVQSNPYGRAHQPVRIPGSCHAKNGNAKPCRVSVYAPKIGYDLSLFNRWVHDMPPGPWSATRAAESPALPGLGASGESERSLFSPSSGRGALSLEDLLSEDVYEGGTDVTRWSRFNQISGIYISQARAGKISVDESRDKTMIWMYKRMHPAWDEKRFYKEFEDVLAVDCNAHGAMPSFNPPMPIVPDIAASEGLRWWAASNWATLPIPSHEFLVDKLLIKGETHLFVSEGGAGKTMLITDLAMKIAAWQPGDEYFWCGQKILSGGTVVLILCEDSKTETHIRMIKMDKSGLIQKSEKRFIVLPMPSLYGAFSLAERDDTTKGMGASKRWSEMLGLLAQLDDLKLVAIDTLNSVSHGDENSAVVIGEMMREAIKVCGLKTNPALLFNHHVRKASKKEPIASLEDLRDSIRGSSAIPSIFRINFGMYRTHNWSLRMQAMDLQPKKDQLWTFGIAKCNIGGILKEEKTLLRNDIGLLEDVTALDEFSGDKGLQRLSEEEEWLIMAIKLAATSGHPYTNGSKNAANGLYKRRNELHPILAKLGYETFERLIKNALEHSRVVPCAARGSKEKKYLDTPNGPLATDDMGAELTAGAYLNIPKWEDYMFHKNSKAIVLKSFKRAGGMFSPDGD